MILRKHYLFKRSNYSETFTVGFEPNCQCQELVTWREWRAERGANGAPTPGIQHRGASKEWN